jgi:ABC-type hemin transport system substrate-binding protein
MSNRWVLLIVVGFCLGLLVLVTYRHRHVPGAPEELNPAESTAKPARIVSLAPNLTEILFALGLGEQVVAVSSDSDYPPEASERS